MGENKMKIGLFADSHYAEIGRIGSRLPSASYDKLLEAIEAFKTAGVRFIFCLGDLLQATDDPETDRKAAEKIMQPLRDCGIPVYYIWGNHDSEAMPADNLCRIACALSAPACVSYEGRTLVLLDLNYKRDGTPYQAGENDWTNTAMPDDEYDWLKSILRAADGEVGRGRRPARHRQCGGGARPARKIRERKPRIQRPPPHRRRGRGERHHIQHPPRHVRGAYAAGRAVPDHRGVIRR